MDEATRALWQTYRDDRCACHRDELISLYWPLVRRVAGNMKKTMPAHVDIDDIVSMGTIGLIRAVENFDLERGVKFETYAITTIRGSILDELRTQDWVPRSVRRRQRIVDHARLEIENETGIDPSTEEVATHLGWSSDRVFHTESATEVGRQHSLDEADDDGNSRYEHIEDRLGADPYALSAYTASLRTFEQLWGRFTAQTQLILALHYYERATLSEVARITGIPEGRVSLVHTDAILLLRDFMRLGFEE